MPIDSHNGIIRSSIAEDALRLESVLFEIINYSVLYNENVAIHIIFEVIFIRCKTISFGNEIDQIITRITNEEIIEPYFAIVDGTGADAYSGSHHAAAAARTS